MFNKKISKSIALGLLMSTIIIPTSNSAFALENMTNSTDNIEFVDEKQISEPDIFSQNLIETINIDGIDYIFKYYYNEEGLPTISSTNLKSNKTDVLEFDYDKNTICFNNSETTMFLETSDSNEISTKSSKWHLIAGPSHVKVTWALGASVNAVASAIAGALKAPASVVVNFIGSGLSSLASKATGGTVHFSKYYRDLALGQVQYRTDWSFVASNGKRYGTYNYYSTPQS